MFKITVKIEGMMCGNCERHVNEAIHSAFSPKKVNSSHIDKETVMLIKEDIDTEKVKKVIEEETGYKVVEIKKEPYKSLFGF